MFIAGGGEVSQNQSYDIDKFIVESSKKEKPNFLFIPTAIKNAKPYVETVSYLYESLGCKTVTLYLSNADIIIEEIDQKFKRTEIIYVGVGNTAYMKEVCKKYGVDKDQMRSFKSGKVLSGLSAESICWFIAGHSDSELIRYWKPKT